MWAREISWVGPGSQGLGRYPCSGLSPSFPTPTPTHTLPSYLSLCTAPSSMSLLFPIPTGDFPWPTLASVPTLPSLPTHVAASPSFSLPTRPLPVLDYSVVLPIHRSRPWPSLPLFPAHLPTAGSSLFLCQLPHPLGPHSGSNPTWPPSSPNPRRKHQQLRCLCAAQ